MMKPRLLSLYIARRFFAMLTLILLAVGTVALLAQYLEVLRRFGDDEGFSALLGLRLAFMRVLILLDLTLPFAFLFGAIVSLIDLSRKLELVVARASGISVWGFLRGPLVVAVVFGILATTLFNPFAVAMRQEATRLEAQLSGKAPRTKGYWFRQQSEDGQSIVHVGSSDEGGGVLLGVTAFVFDTAGRFREKAVASRAEFAGDRWILTDATVVSAERPEQQVERYELPTDADVAGLRESFVAQQAVSVWSLPILIRTGERAGLDPDRFKVDFHVLLSRPFMLAAMVLIAATVSLRLTRYGGTWRLVLIGATIGFLLYAVSEVVGDLGGNGIIDPVLAAWLSPIVALTLGASALLYQEDG